MISKLRQSRINLNLTVEEVSERLKIRKQYIIALEENRLDEIPGSAYINGYMKMYCNYVGVPYSEYASLEENMEDVCIEPLFSKVGSIHRASIAILLMIILVFLGWYYISHETHHRSTIIEHLENIDHKGYLIDSTNKTHKTK